MKKNNINFVKLLKNYKVGWIGISSDYKSVLLSGKTLKEARNKAKKLKEKVFFFPAGQSYSDFIGQIKQ